MKKEELTINNLLTWDEVFNIGNPDGDNLFWMSISVLENQVCKNKYKSDELHKKFIELIHKEFIKLSPPVLTDISSKVLTMREENTNSNRFCLGLNKGEDGKLHPSFSKLSFWSYTLSSNIELLKGLDGKYNPDYYKVVETQYVIINDLMKLEDEEARREYIISKLKEIKLGFINKIKAIDYENEHKKLPVITKKFIANQVTRDFCIQYRSYISCYIKKYDEINKFLERDFPTEILELMDKDKFLLLFSEMFGKSMAISYFKSNNEQTIIDYSNRLPKDKLKTVLNCINNYLLVVEYLNHENGSNYSEELKFFDTKNRLFSVTTDSMRKWLETIKTIGDNKDLIKYHSYEELLSDKASESWKKIVNKKLVNNIKVNFEMIKCGPKIEFKNNPYKNNGIKKISSNSEKRKAKLKHDYDILDEKLDFYYSKNPVINLVGINTFTGYFAQFYENGVVILDKLYTYRKDKKGTEAMVPAGDEAIYVMNYREFAELSKSTKMELIQEITEYDNKDVRRIYHSKTWKEKVDSYINGKGYGELDLSFISMLSNELVLENEKKLVK